MTAGKSAREVIAKALADWIELERDISAYDKANSILAALREAGFDVVETRQCPECGALFGLHMWECSKRNA